MKKALFFIFLISCGIETDKNNTQLNYGVEVNPPTGIRPSDPVIPPVYSCSGDTRSRYIAPDPTASLLFNGTGTPESQGWIRENFTNCIDSSDVVITLKGATTYYTATTKRCAMNEYLKDSGVSNSFYVTIRVAVVANSDSHDGGFSFSPIGSIDPYHYDGVWPERSYGLLIESCRIGFQDYSNFYDVNATLFHTYLIVYKSGMMAVYIDNSYDEVLLGVATPVLLRSVPSSYGSLRRAGVIVFGDTTNADMATYGYDLNSSFQLDYVTFKTIN